MSMTETGSPSLNSEHLAIFAPIGIGPELLAAAGVHDVSDQEARDYGFRASSDLSGIVFPYVDLETGHRVTSRLRRDHPDMDSNGKVLRKYLCPFGDPRHLYFPPGASEMLADTSITVVFVEAEKSSLALTALAGRSGRKLLVIATGGCWGWHGKVGITTNPTGERQDIHGPLADFCRVSWPGRKAIIVFDANAR